MYASDYFKSPIFHLLHSTSKKCIHNVLVWVFIFSTGNKYIHSLTVLGYTYLRIEVMTFGNAVRFIEYPDFQIGDSTENYVLRSIGTPTAKSAGRIFFLGKRIRKLGGGLYLEPSEEAAQSKIEVFVPVNCLGFKERC